MTRETVLEQLRENHHASVGGLYGCWISATRVDRSKVIELRTRYKYKVSWSAPDEQCCHVREFDTAEEAADKFASLFARYG